MAKLMEKLKKLNDSKSLESELLGVAFNSFAAGVLISDIPREVSKGSYVLVITELIVTSICAYASYKGSKRISENYKQ